MSRKSKLKAAILLSAMISASIASAQLPVKTMTMQEAGFSAIRGDAVVLGDGNTISIGQKFPDGAELKSIDLSSKSIETDRYVLTIKMDGLDQALEALRSPGAITKPQGERGEPVAKPQGEPSAANDAPQSQLPTLPPPEKVAVRMRGQPTVVERQRVSPSPAEALAQTPRVQAGNPPSKEDQGKRLPALKKDDPALKPFVVHTRIGINEVVNVSSRLLNRISTPFPEPVIVDTSGAKYKIVGSEIFLLPANDEPAGIYIFNKNDPTQTISLTIVPQGGIPGQNILVKLEDFRPIGDLALAKSARNALATQANDYESSLVKILLAAVNGEINGFSPVPLHTDVAVIDEIQITPDVVFQGQTLDVYRYRLRNMSKSVAALHEGAFYRKGIKAISFFPKTELAPDEQTFVYIVSDKAMAEGPRFSSPADERVMGQESEVWPGDLK